MDKPKKPIEPNIFDKKKYPQSPTKDGKSISGNAIYLPNQDFIRDYDKYQKDLKQYNIDIELYEQIKLIRFVKNANEKLILKKYKIVKVV